MIWEIAGGLAMLAGGYAMGWTAAERDLRSMPDREARAVLLAWAESGGFAATHGAGATSEEIADDFLGYARRIGWKLVRLG